MLFLRSIIIAFPAANNSTSFLGHSLLALILVLVYLFEMDNIFRLGLYFGAYEIDPAISRKHEQVLTFDEK